MKKLFFMLLIVVSVASIFVVGCQKEVTTSTIPSNDMMAKFDASKAMKTLSEIQYSEIQVVKGVLQFRQRG